MKAKHQVARYRESVKEEAFSLYLAGTHPLTAIAELFKVPMASLRNWYTRGAWPKRRKQIEERIKAKHVESIEGMISDAVPTVLKRHLLVAQKIEDEVGRRFDAASGLESLDVMNLSKAFHQSAAISQKAVGIGIRGTQGQMVINSMGGVVQVGAMPLGPASDDEASEEDVTDAVDLSAFND